MSTSLKQLACATLFAACSAAVLAQPAATTSKPPTPEEMKQVMQASMQASFAAMVSTVGPMTEAAIEAQLVVAAKPESALRLAAFKRNLYEELLKKGFNPQQALQIVISTSAPSTGTLGIK